MGMIGIHLCGLRLMFSSGGASGDFSQHVSQGERNPVPSHQPDACGIVGLVSEDLMAEHSAM